MSRPLVLAILLVTAPMAGCLLSSDEGASSSTWSDNGSPQLIHTLGDPEHAGLGEWPGPFDNKPAMHDFDGDGVDEIVGHSQDTHVYVFDSDSGRALASLPTTYPAAWHIERILNSPEAAVLDPGEPPSIVVANHAAFVSVWQYDPQASDEEEFVFHKRWEKRMTSCTDSPSMDAGPVLADLDDDGSQEILIQTEEEGFYAFESDGTLKWEHCWAGGHSEPTVADLHGDGTLEAIFGSDSGFISVIDGESGDPLWTFDASEHVEPASVVAAPTVADLDGEPPLEILFPARNATYTEEARYDENSVAIFAINGYRSNGTSEILWMRTPSWANPISSTQLVVEDVDGDGTQDIFGMDWNTIGHRPGNWEHLGPANVFRLTATGEDVWVREVDAWWSNQDIALGDFDGDGNQEVLVNAPVEGGDGLWRLSAATGEAEGFLSTSPWKVQRSPLPVDIDGDDSMEIVFPVRPMDESLERGSILLYDLDVPYNATRLDETPPPPEDG